jgi:hypothetical protein
MKIRTLQDMSLEEQDDHYKDLENIDKETLYNIKKYVNMKPVDKMNFIACNNEDVMYMIDYLVNITKNI